MQVLDDPGGQLNAAQALARQAEFQPVSALKTMDRSHRYWILVNLRSTLDHDRELRVDLPTCEEFHSFVIGDNAQLRERRTSGARQPVAAR